MSSNSFDNETLHQKMCTLAESLLQSIRETNGTQPLFCAGKNDEQAIAPICYVGDALASELENMQEMEELKGKGEFLRRSEHGYTLLSDIMSMDPSERFVYLTGVFY